MKKTFLEKLESNNHLKTYRCKENDAVIVFKQEEGDTGDVYILVDENSTSAVVIGLQDWKNAMNELLEQTKLTEV